jgi:predicted O-methyltransferase YrrM
MKTLIAFLKNNLKYIPMEDLKDIRLYLKNYFSSIETKELCQPYLGDFIYKISKKNRFTNALELGLATGTSAIYLLESVSGEVSSIDFAQEADWNNVGINLIRNYKYANRHRFLSGKTEIILPDLYNKNETFDLIFLDGWKTFDHLAVDLFYCIRLLNKNGMIIFDDTNMKSVKKIINMMCSHYDCKEINYYEINETFKNRVYSILTKRSFERPFRAFVFKENFRNAACVQHYDFFKNFN